MAQHVSELSGEKLEIALQIRTATVEIVRDALEKRLYGFPVSFAYTCCEPVDSYKFCCIPTESFLRDLLKKLEEVSFKEDTDPDSSDTFAYVYPGHLDDTVYLCQLFWEALDNLPCRPIEELLKNEEPFDSKPGTLIHEVSHLLGTDDITYAHRTVELWECEFGEGILMGRSACVIDEWEMGHYLEEVAQINANSLEHEFETIINHEESYQDGKYMCCGESKIHSVCNSRSTGHYQLHKRPEFDKHKKKMEENLEKKRKEMLLNNKITRYEKIRNSVCKKTCMPLK